MTTTAMMAAAVAAVARTASAVPTTSAAGTRRWPSSAMDAAPTPSRPSWVHSMTAEIAAAATPTSCTPAVRAATNQKR